MIAAPRRNFSDCARNGLLKPDSIELKRQRRRQLRPWVPAFAGTNGDRDALLLSRLLSRSTERQTGSVRPRESGD